MDSLQAIMRLKQDRYILHAVFIFNNPGDQRSVRVRFPVLGGADCSPPRETPAFTNFDLWVNGLKTQIRQGKDWINSAKASLGRLVSRLTPKQFGGPTRLERYLDSLLNSGTVNWLLADVSFPANAVTTMRFRCEGTYFSARDGKLAAFLLETASKWGGTMRNASFTIDCTEVGGLEHCDIKLYHYAPEWSAMTTKNTIRYEKSNYDHLERQQGISVTFQ